METLLDALAERLATGNMPSAGVDHDTGELTMLRARLLAPDPV
jgi:hypothetical protein